MSLPHPPQPARLQLQADDEQQQRDADFGDALDARFGLDDQAEACGPITAPLTM